METLKVKKLTDNARIPRKGLPGAAGYDLYSAYEYCITPGSCIKVQTDIAVKVPKGCYGRIAPRSSLALMHSISIEGGVIDPDYIGNIGILMRNQGKTAYNVKKGDRCAQLILEKIQVVELEEVEVLQETMRGTQGYGSTGER